MFLASSDVCENCAGEAGLIEEARRVPESFGVKSLGRRVCVQPLLPLDPRDGIFSFIGVEEFLLTIRW